MQVTGNIVKIKEAETIPSKSGGKDFVKREFWLQLPEDRFPQTIAFELTGDKIDLIDAYHENQEITVEFNLRGRIWNDRCFNTLSAWKIQGGESNLIANNRPSTEANTTPAPAFLASDSSANDDLPF